MDNVGNRPVRGQTWETGTASSPKQSKYREGTLYIYNDTEKQTGVDTPRSGKQVVMKLVRNVSGVALEAKRIVKYKSGTSRTHVDGYCNADHENVAGAVDEFVPTAGVPNNHLFLVAVRGPALIKTSLAGNAQNVISDGDIMTALTAATSQATTAGRVQSFAATSNMTNAVSAAINRIGRALSAKTTANTNADLLVDLEIQSNQ